MGQRVTSSRKSRPELHLVPQDLDWSVSPFRKIRRLRGPTAVLLLNTTEGTPSCATLNHISRRVYSLASRLVSHTQTGGGQHAGTSTLYPCRTFTGSLNRYSLVSLGAKTAWSVFVWLPRSRPASGDTLITPEEPLGGSTAKMTGIRDVFFTFSNENSGSAGSESIGNFLKPLGKFFQIHVFYERDTPDAPQTIHSLGRRDHNHHGNSRSLTQSVSNKRLQRNGEIEIDARTTHMHRP